MIECIFTVGECYFLLVRFKGHICMVQFDFQFLACLKFVIRSIFLFVFHAVHGPVILRVKYD